MEFLLNGFYLLAVLIVIAHLVPTRTRSKFILWPMRVGMVAVIILYALGFIFLL